jgi:hypothetical protein
MCDSWTKKFFLASPTMTMTGSESKLWEVSGRIGVRGVSTYDGPSAIERLKGLGVDMPFRLIVVVSKGGDCERGLLGVEYDRCNDFDDSRQRILLPHGDW